MRDGHHQKTSSTKNRYIPRLIQKFLSDEQGGLIIFALLVLISMLVLGGMAVDFMRQENERIVLQGIADRSVLSAASLEQEYDGKLLIDDYFLKAGYEKALNDGQPFFEDLGNEKTASVAASSEINTFFLRLIGIDTLSVNAAAVANEAVGRVEISLVIDASLSMAGSGSNPRISPNNLDTGGRIFDLRNASKAFASAVLDPDNLGQVSLTIIPYAGHVNPGQDMFEILGGSGDDADNFIIPFDAILPGTKSPYTDQPEPISRIAVDPDTGEFVLVVEGTVVGIPSITSTTIATAAPYPLVDSNGLEISLINAAGVLQTVTNADISRVVFVTGYDNDTGAFEYDDWDASALVVGEDAVLDPGAGNVLEVEYSPPHACMEVRDPNDWTSTAPPVTGQPKLPQFMFWIEQPHRSFLLADEVTGWGWCPHNNTSIRYAFQDAEDAIEYIDEVRLHYGTGTNIGMKWGAATLDPAMQPHFATLNSRDPDALPDDFINRPAAFEDDETRKIIVLMTDGRVTAQHRPSLGDEVSPANLVNADPSDLSSHDDWRGLGIGGRARSITSAQAARDELVAMCNLAKNAGTDAGGNGIEIFTVAFEFPQPGDDGFDAFSANRTAMSNCATPDTLENQYYFEASGAGLTAVFEEIAGQLSGLRLMK